MDGVVVSSVMAACSRARRRSWDVSCWNDDHEIAFSNQLVECLGELPDVGAIVRLVVSDADVEDPDTVGIDQVLDGFAHNEVGRLAELAPSEASAHWLGRVGFKDSGDVHVPDRLERGVVSDALLEAWVQNAASHESPMMALLLPCVTAWPELVDGRDETAQ